MEGNKITYETIDHYISNQSPEIQEILEKIRNVIQEAAPEATEKDRQLNADLRCL